MKATRKNFILCAIFAMLSFTSFGQTEKYATPLGSISNMDRYGIDFEVVEFGANPDTAYVNSLNLDEFEHTRKHDEDNKIYDLNNGYTILIYSYEKVKVKKSSTQVNKETNQLSPWKSSGKARRPFKFNLFKS